jgi:hypothetical protein
MLSLNTRVRFYICKYLRISLEENVEQNEISGPSVIKLLAAIILLIFEVSSSVWLWQAFVNPKGYSLE